MINWLLLFPFLICGEAVWHDLRTREIPDNVSLRISISGILATGLSWHTLSLPEALIGILVGFIAVLPFTLLDGIGGGDLKLLAALGAWLGVTGTFGLLFWTAMSGMGLAIIAVMRGQNDYAYAPAILCGLLVTICFPTALSSLAMGLRNLF